MDVDDYCRQVETYLCRKNDGHLIRIVGPSFERVSQWAEMGVPVKIACGGIDRYLERYYAKGPRRRPVRIDFCEADVLDLFDRWRRAVGVAGRLAGAAGAPTEVAGAPESDVDLVPGPSRASSSLPAHLERVIARLTARRAGGVLAPTLDADIERVVREVDGARAEARGARGEARAAIVRRLDALDARTARCRDRRLDAFRVG